MPPYFLIVRFPLVFLGDDCLERLQDPPPLHETEGHVFYQTDLQVVAEKLVELFRHGEPDPATWNPTASFREVMEKVQRGESAVLFPSPIFEIVDGADLELTPRVRFRQEVQQLQEIAPTSFLDPDGWALLGFPNDRRTLLLVGHHKQAQQWEPLVRDELGVWENDTETRNGSAGDVRDPESSDQHNGAHKTKPAEAPSQRTLGALLEAVEVGEAAYRHHIAIAERHEAQGSAEAKWWRTQAEVSRFHPVSGHDPLRGWKWADGEPVSNTLALWPGIDLLEALCQAEFGSGLTSESIRRIRGRLVIDGKAAPVEVDALSIHEVVARLQEQHGRVNRPHGSSDGGTAIMHGSEEALGKQTATTASASARDKVFISYSHKDKKFLHELLTHLKPFIREERISIWSDEQIEPGAKWFDEIMLALASTKVVVMLVTKDFLASDFIHEHELGPLLKEAQQGGVRILWVLVRACVYKETPLKDYQTLIPPDKPLANMTKAERDGAWVKICEAIKAAL